MLFSRERDFDAIIDRAARAEGVPASLVKSVIAQESGFDPAASGDSGQAFGLMQLLLPTARDMGYLAPQPASGLYNPGTNIQLGTKYLAWIRGAHGGSWADVVSAYNGGFRPELGFGRVVAEGGSVHCGGRQVPAGEYCNQTHVDRVTRHFWPYFMTGVAPGSEGFMTAGGGALAAVVALGLLAAMAVR